MFFLSLDLLLEKNLTVKLETPAEKKMVILDPIKPSVSEISINTD
jgi:hypothetical protein